MEISQPKTPDEWKVIFEKMKDPLYRHFFKQVILAWLRDWNTCYVGTMDVPRSYSGQPWETSLAHHGTQLFYAAEALFNLDPTTEVGRSAINRAFDVIDFRMSKLDDIYKSILEYRERMDAITIRRQDHE